MRKFSAAGAKNHFGVLIDSARIAPVAVTKYDKPFLVAMAVEEYEKPTDGKLAKRALMTSKLRGK